MRISRGTATGAVGLLPHSHLPMPTETPSDAQLVAAALADQAAYAAIVDRYGDGLLRYIISVSGMRREDAEDVLQEALLKAYRALRSYDSDMRLSTWLYAIARREAISHWRKAQARPQLAEVTDEAYAAAASVPTQGPREADAALRRDAVQQVLRHMPQHYAEVLYLHYIGEYRYDEIADILRKPSGTVAALISRAKKIFAETAARLQLKDALEEAR